MLDIKQVRKDLNTVVEALQKKGFTFPVEEFQELDSRRKAADMASQQLLAERKKASKLIGSLIARGKSVDEAKAEVDETLGRLSTELDQAVEEARSIQAALDELLMSIPNLPDHEVPFGTDENSNEEVAVWGEPRTMTFEVKDHADIGEALGQLDFELAGKITGSRFSVMKGPLARLQRALTQFMLDKHTIEHGYTEVYVPFIVNSTSLRQARIQQPGTCG